MVVELNSFLTANRLVVKSISKLRNRNGQGKNLGFILSTTSLAACGSETFAPIVNTPPASEINQSEDGRYTYTFAGNDINFSKLNDTRDLKVTTSSGDDIIVTGHGDDYIDSDGGNDLIRGGQGADTIRAGGGMTLFLLWVPQGQMIMKLLT